MHGKMRKSGGKGTRFAIGIITVALTVSMLAPLGVRARTVSGVKYQVYAASGRIDFGIYIEGASSIQALKRNPGVIDRVAAAAARDCVRKYGSMLALDRVLVKGIIYHAKRIGVPANVLWAAEKTRVFNVLEQAFRYKIKSLISQHVQRCRNGLYIRALNVRVRVQNRSLFKPSISWRVTRY